MNHYCHAIYERSPRSEVCEGVSSAPHPLLNATFPLPMRLKEVKAALLKKGWMGRTISRSETVDRINLLIRRHMALNHAYQGVADSARDADVVRALAMQQKALRLDVDKLMETVFSAGGVAYNGVDMEPGDYVPEGGTAAALRTLKDQEAAFLQAVQRESEIEHHMRTRAVLERLLNSSQARTSLLLKLVRSHR